MAIPLNNTATGIYGGGVTHRWKAAATSPTTTGIGMFYATDVTRVTMTTVASATMAWIANSVA